MYGLTVIAGDVGDHPEAYTRFVSVAPYTRIDREGETWRTAFSFATDHRPMKSPVRLPQLRVTLRVPSPECPHRVPPGRGYPA